jgi:hypothetical protein
MPMAQAALRLKNPNQDLSVELYTEIAPVPDLKSRNTAKHLRRKRVKMQIKMTNLHHSQPTL